MNSRAMLVAMLVSLRDSMNWYNSLVLVNAYNHKVRVHGYLTPLYAKTLNKDPMQEAYI